MLMARPKSDGGDGKPLTQKAMVRAGIRELGGGAKPHALHEHIKAKFEKDIPPNIISNYKSVLKREAAAGTGGNGTARRGRKPGTGGGIRVEDLEVVRGLVHR